MSEKFVDFFVLAKLFDEKFCLNLIVKILKLYFHRRFN